MKAQIFILTLFLALTVACNKDDDMPKPVPPDPTDKVEMNYALAENYILYWDSHDIDAIMDLFATECQYWEMCKLRPFDGKEQIKMYFASTLAGLPDTRFAINSVTADEYRAVVEWTWTATNSVGWPQLGIPATGEEMELRGVAVMDIQNGHIIKLREYWDWNTFLIEIGIG